MQLPASRRLTGLAHMLRSQRRSAAPKAVMLLNKLREQISQLPVGRQARVPITGCALDHGEFKDEEAIIPGATSRIHL